MNVALVYDWVTKWGGAERVLLALHELYPDAPIYTSVYNPHRAWWAKDIAIKPSFLQSFPLAARYHELYPLFMPIAFEAHSFKTYDVVISVTSSFAKGVITMPDTYHLCYCLTPMRFLWSHYREYFRNSTLRVLSAPFVSYLRNWDQIAAHRPDTYVSISSAVQKRVYDLYHIQSDVIAPPLTIAGAIPKKPAVIPRQYLLIVSRLVAYKRVDLAIQACSKLGMPLVVVGEGILERKLRSIAANNTYFIHSLLDSELAWVYAHCDALLMPQEEDFGLTAVEAMYYGTPVIAYRAGGALDTVIHNKTGVFFNTQTVQSLALAITYFYANRSIFTKSVLINHAKTFDKRHFHAKIKALIKMRQ